MADVVPLPPPVLVTIPRVELGEVGQWNISNIQGWAPTPEDFAAAVAALDCPAVRKPVLKIGHDGNHGHGDPCLGFVDNLAVTEGGMVLVGDFAGVPGWLGDVDENGHSVLASAYPDRSGEWEHNYVCQLGHTHPFVLHAMALLGVVRPGIGTLQSLHDLYTTPPEPLMPAASTTPTSAATPDDVRYAYYSGPGQSWDLWIREMYIDPAELIVENDADRTLLRVTYDIAADGTVTFGEPQKVEVKYVAARAADPATRQLVFASRAEARPGTPPAPTTPAAAPAPGSPAPNQEGTGMDPVKLREALGLAADASDIEVSAALAVAGLTAPADPATTTTTETVEVTEETPATTPDGGLVQLPAPAVEDLVAAAAQGRQAFQQLHEQKREGVISSAVRAGKILPGSEARWRDEFDRDPASTSAYLEKAPQIVPVSEVGHADTDDPANQDDGWFDGFPIPTAAQKG